jgi:hypothetical protein
MPNNNLIGFAGILLFAIGGALTFLFAYQGLTGLSSGQAAASGFLSFLVIGVGLLLIVKSNNGSCDKPNIH